MEKLFNIKDYIYYPGEYKMKKFYEDEEYIKMCKWASQNLPTVAPTIGLADGELFYYEYNHTLYKMDGWLFPLYRQDQLQEMLGEDSYTWFRNCWEYVQGEPLPLSSEMVGLERVMKKLHNKTWNGEEWVSE